MGEISIRQRLHKTLPNVSIISTFSIYKIKYVSPLMRLYIGDTDTFFVNLKANPIK